MRNVANDFIPEVEVVDTRSVPRSGVHGSNHLASEWADAFVGPERRYSWLNPDTSVLEDRRGPLPPFPVDAMPAFSAWLTRAARGAGVTPGHIAVPLLSIASSIVGTARRVTASRSWSQPLTLWTALVGFSGTGKTPGIDVTTRALAMVEKNRRTRIAEMRRQHDARVEVAKAANKKWKMEVQDAVNAGRPPPNCGPTRATPAHL